MEKQIDFNIFGSSHSIIMGITIENFPENVKIDFDNIDNELKKRRPNGIISTSRIEKDEYFIVSGVDNGYTTNAPLTIIIENKNINRKDYNLDIMRPSHADYVAYIKTNGNIDLSGGAHYSGRLTALLVILGALCKQLLKEKNIKIVSQVKQIGSIIDDDMNENLEVFPDIFPTVSQKKKEEMIDLIKKTKDDKDSVGGEIKTFIRGVKIGVGNSYKASVKAKIASLVFMIPAVKGVSFGLGEGFKHSYGSDVNDQMMYENDVVKYLSNNNGGIIGGMTTGEDIIVNTIIKPTPTISKKQQTINVKTKENVILSSIGRHDPSIVTRVYVVIESMLALAMVNLESWNTK